MNMTTKRHASRVPIPLYIPNILCYIRIILAFASIYTSSKISTSSSTTTSTSSSSKEDTNPKAFFHLSVTITLWIISSLLDHLDGKLARKYNQCSDLGVLLDIIADNILRSCSWISCLIALLNQQQGTGINTNTRTVNHRDIFGLALVAVVFTSMEWMTMLSMQMIAILKRKSHWKLIPLEEQEEEGTSTATVAATATGSTTIDEDLAQNNDNDKPPWWVETIFQKSFYNPLGVITIYGSMSAGMMHFLHLQREVLLDRFPSMKIVVEGARMIAYVGRLLALCCEMYFCLDFLRLVVRLDERNKVRMIH